MEELKGHGPLTEEQEAELAELQSKMAGWKQHTKGRSATYRQGLRAAADRVVVLEELAGRGQLAEEQAAELAQGWGSGLPTEVAGPKRQPGVSGLEAGKPGPGAKRTRAEAGERSRGKAGESSRGAKRQKAGCVGGCGCGRCRGDAWRGRCRGRSRDRVDRVPGTGCR